MERGSNGMSRLLDPPPQCLVRHSVESVYVYTECSAAQAPHSPGPSHPSPSVVQHLTEMRYARQHRLQGSGTPVDLETTMEQLPQAAFGIKCHRFHFHVNKCLLCDIIIACTGPGEPVQLLKLWPEQLVRKD